MAKKNFEGMEFSSPEMQEIHKNANIIVEDHKARLDLISNDINLFEHTLNQYNIPFWIIYVFKTEINELEAPGLMLNQCLIWDAEKRYLTYGEFFSSHLDRKDKIISTMLKFEIYKRLIETKISIRINTFKEFPSFYKTILKQLEDVPECNGLMEKIIILIHKEKQT